MAPMAPPGAGGQEARRSGWGDRAPGNGYSSAAQSAQGGGISVRPFVGYGVRADFDPVTGALRAAAPGADGLGGVYGDVGGVPVVFYRERAGLALRVGDRMIDLDGPVDIEHGPVDPRHTRFAVTVAGALVCELFYRSLPREMDLGAYVGQVLADPAQRAGIFAH
ncbi:hypothetical protein ACFVAV_19755 [Nocardia sp. NPDC057663]|uniref:hypothetical protein n=1 Tax=Nocardia sp. NPDC057663 TaxID=3346201 RepID=UPI0036723257